MVQLAHIFKKDKDKEKHHQEPKEKQKQKQEKVKEKVRKPVESDSPGSGSGSSPRTSFSTSKSPAKSPTKNRFSHSRSSSSTSNPTAPSFRFATRSTRDQDLHPLNLPPDELRRRLSAMAASRDERSSMDIDPQEAQQKKNGVNGTEQERSPTPPPHRSNSSSTDEADSFKLAGNKFFKDGDYRRAIEEYNKGRLDFASRV